MNCYVPIPLVCYPCIVKHKEAPNSAMKQEKNTSKNEVKTTDFLLEMLALFILISLTFYAIRTGKIF